MSKIKTVIKNGLILGEKIAPSLNHKLAFKLFLKPIGHVREVPADYRPIWEKRKTIPFPATATSLITYHWHPDAPNGQTIILTHGWGANATTMLAFVEPLLNKGFHVVAWDAPAHGKSTGKRTTLPEWIASLKEITADNPTTTGYIAHSFGGMTVTNVLGERYGSVTGIQRFVTLGAPASIREIVEQFAVILDGIPYSIIDGIINRIEEISGHPATEFDASAALRGCELPALIFHDEKDKRVPYDNAQEIVDALINGEKVTTAGLGHRRILRDEVIIDQVVGFFPS